MAERAVRKAHEKKDETEDKPFTCQYCGVEYTVKTVTSHYKRSHPDKYFTDGNVREEFKCSQCEEKYFAKSSEYFCYIQFVLAEGQKYRSKISSCLRSVHH